ncbi:hypothetical protein ACFL6M_02005 [Candidatus Eisenbacteria bacterium]|uniref:Uncharacterized protein n=1 Tax=Eiseniibacteriota bacterium TaxID=2212470 RepID=A0ABV6YJL1_UNCEI
MRIAKYGFLLLAVGLGWASAGADAPGLINYQGVLTNTDGLALEGYHELVFRIYDDPILSSLLWEESQDSVYVEAGLFNVHLGGGSTFSHELWDNTNLWMGISVDAGNELLPRMQLTSTPWALRAAVADSLAGGPVSDGDWEFNGDDLFLAVPGNVGLGTSSPVTDLHIYEDNAPAEIMLSWGPDIPDAHALISQLGYDGLAINSWANGADWADIMFQTNTNPRLFIESAGNVGIGTTTPVELLDVAGTAQVQGIKLPTGATDGYVLTSDADGNGTWLPGAAGVDGHSLDADDGDPVDAVYVDADGNVGIGTATPRRRFEINCRDEIDGLRIWPGPDEDYFLYGDLIHDGQYGFVINSGSELGFGGNLRLETNGTTRMMIHDTGNIGIGVLYPEEKLHVVGTTRTDGFKMPTGATDGHILTSDADGNGTWQEPGSISSDGDWTIDGDDLIAAVSGNVGITGGLSPSRGKLHVHTDDFPVAVYTQSNADGGTALVARNGQVYAYLGGEGDAVKAIGVDGYGVLSESNTIGVRGDNTSSNTTGRLGTIDYGAYGHTGNGNFGYMGGDDYGVYGESDAGNCFGYLGGSSAGVRGEDLDSGNFGYMGSAHYGVYGVGIGAYYGLYGINNTSNNKGRVGGPDYGVYGENNAGGNHGYLGGSDYGVYGKNVATGSFAYLGSDLNALYAQNPTSNTSGSIGGPSWGVLGVCTSSGFGVMGSCGPGTGVIGSSTSGSGVKGTSASGLAGEFVGDVSVSDRLTVDILEITGGSDLSERFEVRGQGSAQTPTPGMVVCIDPANPGALAVSSFAYDKRVAGIISGAGGVSPGMLMGHKGTLADGDLPVALTGRVYCWADASSAPIAPGDLLTTSSTPGHVMKATDHQESHGAILGKAMTSLDSATGLVLVLVNLQ